MYTYVGYYRGYTTNGSASATDVLQAMYTDIQGAQDRGKGYRHTQRDTGTHKHNNQMLNS